MATMASYFRVALLVVTITEIYGQCTPQQLEILSRSSRQVTVKWLCLDGGTTQESNYEYQVNYRLTNFDQCETATYAAVGDMFSKRVDANDLGNGIFSYSATLTNLHPYSSYSISVTARRTDTLMSSTSTPLPTSTFQEAPSAAPANIQTTNIQQTQLTFTWDEVPCGSRHGSITDYVLYRDDSSASTSTPDRQLTFGGLSPGTRYTFNIAARNSIGTGTTEMLIATTMSNPPVISCTSDFAVTASEESGAKVPYQNPTASGGITPYNVACTPNQDVLLSIARHTVTCSVTDAASNKDTCIFTVTVNAQLLLSCPPSTTVTAVSGQSDAEVTYPQPTVTGGTSPQAPSCDPTSGRLFNIGTHTVTCTVMDRAEASATCTIQVEVNPDIRIELPVNANDILTTSIRFSWSEATCFSSCPDGITGYNYQLVVFANKEEIEGGTTDANERTVTITELMPCSEYAFMVAGMSGSVTGAYSSETRVTTDGQVPGGIMSLSLTPQPNSFSAMWQPASGPCPTETYTIEYTLTNKDQCEPTPGSSRMVGTIEGIPGETTIAGLLPYSTYEVVVWAVNSYGNGPEVSMEVTTQSQVTTAAPSDVEVTSTDLVSLSFSWGEVQCGSRHGDITQYNYQLYDESGNVVAGDDSAISNRQITINGVLMPCSTYKFQVGAIWNGMIGPYSESVTAMTSTSVANLNAKPISSTELEVSWEAPTALCTTGVVYEVEYQLTNRGQCQPMDDNAVMNESVSGTTVTLSDLHPYSTYEIQVKASGGVSTMSSRTDETEPSGHPTAINVINTNTTIEITWDKPMCTERNGNITGYTYSLLELEISSSKFKDINTTDTTVIFMDLTPSTTYRFSISANTKSGKGPSHSVDLMTTSADGEPLISGNRSIAAIAGAIAGVFILIILLVITILLLRRRKNKSTTASGDVPLSEKGKHETDEPVDSQDNPMMNGSHNQIDSSVEPNDIYDEQQEIPKPQTPPAHTRPASTDTEPKRGTVYHDINDDDQMEQPPPMAVTLRPNKAPVKDKKPTPKPKAIKIENLADYIAKNKANRSEGFHAEFEDIPFGQQHPFLIAKKPNNLPKNRFKNISAYDHSRVVLEEIKGVPDSDYINASYVKGYKDELYIASQGPNKGAMGDIWRMAWDQNSTKIVMLTNLVEDGKRKCEKYWPEKAKVPFVYFPISVRLKDVREYADYEVRDVILEKDDETEPREIRWFHFTAWPDMGVPDYPTPLLNFMKVVKAYEPEGSGLPIVHCSAGVGRTGTYITIDATMKMAHDNGRVDINAIVRKLRQDRIKMVQTNIQYEFIYDTVQEALTCGDTSILITNLRQGFQDLQQPIKKGKGKTKLEQQFEILDDLTVVRTKKECRGGYAAENVDKNRFQDLVPWEKRRPYVMTPGAEGSTNYVNATYLDGYVKKNEFISTQMPLPNTIEDFWRLVYNFKSPTIIMLNGMSYSDPSLGTYWIDSGTLPFTSITVEHVKTKPYMDELTGRIFKIYENDRPKDFITVQQYQFNAWPLGQDTPDSTSALISMIDLMEKWQHQQEKKLGKRPITVHCIDGVGVSGVFCALVSVLEKMKVEKVVDVFQSVKRLRMNRPGMVANLEQYTLLYKAAQVSLEELEIYANFAKTE